MEAPVASGFIVVVTAPDRFKARVKVGVHAGAPVSFMRRWPLAKIESYCYLKGWSWELGDGST